MDGMGGLFTMENANIMYLSTVLDILDILC